MNYLFTMNGLVFNNQNGAFDYSWFVPPPLDELHLNETIGLNDATVATGYGTAHYCPGANPDTDPAFRVLNANGLIDWNCNRMSEASISVDVNADTQTTVLTSYNDWANLIFKGGSVGQLGAGIPQPDTPFDEIDELTFEEASHQTNPLLVSVASPGSVNIPAGGSGDVTFTVKNIGTQNDSYALGVVDAKGWGSLAGVPANIALNAGRQHADHDPRERPSRHGAGNQRAVDAQGREYGESLTGRQWRRLRRRATEFGRLDSAGHSCERDATCERGGLEQFGRDSKPGGDRQRGRLRRSPDYVQRDGRTIHCHNRGERSHRQLCHRDAGLDRHPVLRRGSPGQG